jgi:hypothetical protein
MKRAPTSAPGSPAAKKQKIAPAPDAPASGAAGGTGAGASGNGGGDGEWTRVERRKSKKAKKVAAIKDVCAASLSPSARAHGWHRAERAAPFRVCAGRDSEAQAARRDRRAWLRVASRRAQSAESRVGHPGSSAAPDRGRSAARVGTRRCACDTFGPSPSLTRVCCRMSLPSKRSSSSSCRDSRPSTYPCPLSPPPRQKIHTCRSRFLIQRTTASCRSYLRHSATRARRARPATRFACTPSCLSSSPGLSSVRRRSEGKTHASSVGCSSRPSRALCH